MGYNKIQNDALNILLEDILFYKRLSDDLKVQIMADFLEQFQERGLDIETSIQNQRIGFVGDPLFEQAYTNFKNRS